MTRKSDRAGSDRPAEDGDRLWQRVALTVTPLAPRRMPVSPPTPVQTAPTNRPRPASGPAPAPVPSPMPRPQSAPSDLDPRRHRRVSREREPIEARLDLHGHGRFQAEDVLTGFLLRAHQRGLRVVLVITGHGRRAGGGEGVIRASLLRMAAQPCPARRGRGLCPGAPAPWRRRGLVHHAQTQLTHEKRPESGSFRAAGRLGLQEDRRA